MIEVLGNRKAALVREVSKVFQEVIREDLRSILERVNDGVKGELVLVVEGYHAEAGDLWKAEADEMLAAGKSVKDIVSELQGRVSKNELKKYLVQEKSEGQ